MRGPFSSHGKSLTLRPARRSGAYRIEPATSWLQTQTIAQTIHINLPDFMWEPSVGAGNSLDDVVLCGEKQSSKQIPWLTKTLTS